ncbi:MAG: DUF4126 domain-containing protein [Bacillota bacterium]
MEYILSLLIGISLSATSGFRVFVPLLILSIASLAGWVELSPAFAWIGSYPALAALAVATALELGAYFFPFIDNLLGAASVPVSMVAGILITASVIVDLHPMLTWTLAIVTGGGAALGGSALSNLLHAGSTATTGGTANPALSLVETVFSFFIAILAVLVPVFAFLLLALIVFIVIKRIGRMKRGAAIKY